MSKRVHFLYVIWCIVKSWNIWDFLRVLQYFRKVSYLKNSKEIQELLFMWAMLSMGLLLLYLSIINCWYYVIDWYLKRVNTFLVENKWNYISFLQNKIQKCDLQHKGNLYKLTKTYLVIFIRNCHKLWRVWF